MLVVEKENEVRIVLDQKTIGYIVRAKRNESHAPPFYSQHAECIKPHGELIGFGYRRNLTNGGSLGRSWHIIARNREGMTYDIGELLTHASKNSSAQTRHLARQLIDASFARETDYMSAVLIIETPSEQICLDFAKAWEHLEEKPKNFHTLGGNCAIRAYEIFVEAKILPKGKAPLTPNQLFHQLTQALENAKGYTVQQYFGYIGFEINKAAGYDLIIKL